MGETSTSYTEYYEKYGFNLRALVILPKVTGFISIIGSSYVIRDILRDPRKLKEKFVFRIMLGLSISDIIFSFAFHFLTTWPMLKGDFLYAAGTKLTCDIDAFFNVMTLFVSPLYNCSLATYFIIQVKYQWRDHEIKAVEKWFHIVPWTVGLIPSMVGAIGDYFGPFGASCWITQDYPFGCENDPAVECRSSKNAQIGFMYFYVFTSLASIFFVSIVMFMTYHHVRKIEKDAEKYSFSFFRKKRKKKKLSSSNRVLIRGIFYNIAVFLPMITVFIAFVYSTLFRKGPSQILYTLAHICFPLRGAFNALIYKIPNFEAYCERMYPVLQTYKEKWYKICSCWKKRQGNEQDSKPYTVISSSTNQHQGVLRNSNNSKMSTSTNQHQGILRNSANSKTSTKSEQDQKKTSFTIEPDSHGNTLVLGSLNISKDGEDNDISCFRYNYEKTHISPSNREKCDRDEHTDDNANAHLALSIRSRSKMKEIQNSLRKIELFDSDSDSDSDSDQHQGILRNSNNSKMSTSTNQHQGILRNSANSKTSTKSEQDQKKTSFTIEPDSHGNTLVLGRLNIAKDGEDNDISCFPYNYEKTQISPSNREKCDRDEHIDDNANAHLALSIRSRSKMKVTQKSLRKIELFDSDSDSDSSLPEA